MKGEIHYIDLHYKGVKIMRGWRHLLFDCFLAVWCMGAAGTMYGYCRFHGWNFLKAGSWQLIPWKEVGMCLIYSSLAGIAVLLVCAGLFWPLWDYVRNLERLCQLIYSYPLYLTNDILSPNMFQEKRTQVKREIAYFASLYYRRRKGMTEVTVRLDGSKFHKSGDFEKLLDVLEDMYALNVIDIRKRQGYLTYCLLSDASRLRIAIGDVIPKGYAIPIMEGISWNIAKIPHALIVGVTGGGKSFFLNALLRGFVLMGADLRICDPKNSALADYRAVLPYVASSTEGIIKNVKGCVELMEQRYKDIKGHEDYVSGQDFTHYRLPPVILVLDEYVAFASTLVKKEKDEFKSCLNQIVLKGREAGVFVILATQRPDAEYLSGNIRDQMGLRVALGKMSRDGYHMTFGATEQKLESNGIKGRGYLYMDGFTFIQEFYAPFVPSSYRFIEEVAKIRSAEPCALTPQGGKASADSETEEAGGAGYKIVEVLYEEE